MYVQFDKGYGIYRLHLDGAGNSLGGSANNSLPSEANSPGSAGHSPGGSAGDSPRTSHSFEPVNEPKTIGASAEASARARSTRLDYSPEFELAWQSYPARAGGNSKSAAFKAWKARLSEGINPETMLEGVKRYAGWVSATGNAEFDDCPVM